MLPLRLVIDTNVIVSAVLKPEGFERAALVVALTKPARLYVSRPILEEYVEVLSRPVLKIRKGTRRQLVQWIRNNSYVITPSRIPARAIDPDDDKFLDCADAARADYLITGNVKHFPRFWKSTKIIPARDFIDVVAPHLIPGAQ
ncbi:MAG TPA: putative toxin-antitoxin system toxin component, PIN family [Dongiaceae bacterium]|nr:putative toxin-antitoxin system toxin component, PIN family [Dongiaceae bacterium]